eukprot:scaffold36996_cov61-Phaeocystis_antarctica.AAC.3
MAAGGRKIGTRVPRFDGTTRHLNTLCAPIAGTLLYLCLAQLLSHDMLARLLNRPLHASSHDHLSAPASLAFGEGGEGAVASPLVESDRRLVPLRHLQHHLRVSVALRPRLGCLHHLAADAAASVGCSHSDGCHVRRPSVAVGGGGGGHRVPLELEAPLLRVKHVDREVKAAADSFAVLAWLHGHEEERLRIPLKVDPTRECLPLPLQDLPALGDSDGPILPDVCFAVQRRRAELGELREVARLNNAHPDVSWSAEEWPTQAARKRVQRRGCG